MRKALVVGIDHYKHVGRLHGCVRDAHAVKAMLDRHGDGSVNFSVQLLVGDDPTDVIRRSELKDKVRELFEGDPEVALLYFAGHGYIEPAGGYLTAGDSERGDDGVPLSEVLTYAGQSKAKNKVLVLDSCHSGVAGNPTGLAEAAQLNEGMTILTASEADQYASEENGAGVFTTLFVNALGGAAANLVGEITPGSVYAHIDQSLGPWEQRPVFKTNVKNFVSLRTVEPPISLADLRRIAEFFPEPGYQFGLDPSFEEELTGRPEGAIPPDPAKVAIFKILQKYNRVNLVVPVDAPHMWHAAIESKCCKLTVLGEHYWKLVTKQRI